MKSSWRALRSPAASLPWYSAASTPALAQRGVHLLGRLDRRRVDEAGAVLVATSAIGALQLVVLVGDLEDAVVQVRPVHAGVDDRESADAELAGDVGDDLVGGGRREGEQRRLAEPRQGAADLEERGPEVVAPLRDAVRLVDDEQAHRMAQRPDRGSRRRRGARAS